MTYYRQFQQKKKQFALLIDPDKPSDEHCIRISTAAEQAGVDFFFVGGSLLANSNIDHCIRNIKAHSKIPVVLFPGNTLQMSYRADAILFLSLISGRNAELLIGSHVVAAPYLKMSNIEVIPTGYMLIDSGRPTSVTYMSNSFPIPRDKKDLAACTAMAGDLLGMKLIFMDAGSGAEIHIPSEMISMVKESIDVPLIVGGGIRSPQKAAELAKAGADVIVVGNSLENRPERIKEFHDAIMELNG